MVSCKNPFTEKLKLIGVQKAAQGDGGSRDYQSANVYEPVVNSGLWLTTNQIVIMWPHYYQNIRTYYGGWFEGMLVHQLHPDVVLKNFVNSRLTDSPVAKNPPCSGGCGVPSQPGAQIPRVMSH